eukprot:1960363-Pyramimonas_sp.AAC.1
MQCITDRDWSAQLDYDDCVITHAPDLDHFGCFPEYKWISLPPCKETPRGPDLALTEYLGDPST